VAIVAATVRGGQGLEDGWIAIPMSGRGKARVRGAPGTAVTLRVGDQVFGPAVTGGDGVAAIAVVVPPGIHEAHQGFRPIDLHVPETSLLHVVADRSVVAADREERLRVVAYVVAPHGAARRGDAPVFEPSRGSVSVAEREAGAYVASWTLPPGPAGEDRLLVHLHTAPASRAVVRVEAQAGAPAVVALVVDREALVAGGPPAGVTARTLDAAGNPVAATLALDVRGAVLSEVVERRPGEVRARLSAGTLLHADEAVVTATATALGISGARAVPLRPAEPALGTFEERAVVRGDGKRETLLRLSVTDRFGNPVSGTAPTASAERGRIAGVALAAPGAWDVRYVAPAVEQPVPDLVAARVGGVRATLSPLVAPPAPALRLEARGGAAADLRGRFSAVEGAVAVERPADVEAALLSGLEAALRLEAGGLSSDGGRLSLLAGPALRRDAWGGVAALSATAGVLLGGGGVAPAARLALSAGLARGRLEPFLEVSALGAVGSSPFVAAGVALGVRLGVEGGP
jgi:hypothetical protein